MRARLFVAPLLAIAFLLGRFVVPDGRNGAALAADPSAPTDFADVVARAEPGVVHVHTYLTSPRAVVEPGEPTARDDAAGSGFVWASDGWIVTNRHVVEGARTILVDVLGRGWLTARVVGEDRVLDVALLKVDAEGLVALPRGDPRSLRKGAWAIAAGSPYRLERSFTLGIVSGLDRNDVGVNPEGYEDFIQTDAAVNLGGSGGPLLDARGRVVGVNTAILSRTQGNQGVAFAVPIDVVAVAVEQLRATGAVVRPALGAVVRSLPPIAAQGLPSGGLAVARTVDDSPARRAGLRTGDVIVRVDGRPVGSRGALLRYVWGKRAGEKVRLTLWRRGETVDADVTLTDR